MDLDTIKKLMKAMEENDIFRVSLKDEKGFELELEKGSTNYVHQPMPPAAPPAFAPPLEETAAPKGETSPASSQKGGHEITSPMVGTFYSRPSPDDPPFVSVGDTVNEDTVVCIIEAMKVMNEVKAGKKGVVKEVFVDNAHPVEFGTNLFLIEG